MTETADQFDGWRKLLELAKANRTTAALRAAILASGVQIIEDEPLSGYYRASEVKGGPRLPVKIERDEYGVLTVLRGSDMVTLSFVWPYCAWNPVSEEAYTAAMAGQPWPDQAVIEQPTEEQPVEETSAGKQQPEHIQVADKYKKQIAQLRASAAENYARITAPDQADAAQELRSMATRVAGQVNKDREALNRPHLTAMREINDTLNPVMNDGKALAETIRVELNEYRKRAEAEAAEAAAQAAAAAPPPSTPATDESGLPPNHQIGANNPPEPIVEPVAPPAQQPLTFKGSRGRSARVVDVNTAVIVNYDALFAHIKGFQEIKDAMQKTAQRLVDAGQSVPGVEVKQDRDVA